MGWNLRIGMPVQGIKKIACENLVSFDNDHHSLKGTL